MRTPTHKKPFQTMTIGTGGDNTRVGKTNLFEITDHIKLARQDLTEVRGTGCVDYRAPIAGYQVQPSVGVFDFRSSDEYMACLKDLGFRVTLDALHHNNYTHIENGFLNKLFVESFPEYVLRLCDRYADSILEVNPINESYTNAVFSMHQGKWYPHKTDIKALVRAFVNLAKAICITTRAIKLDATGHRIPNSLKTVHIDTCENHQALDQASQSYVDYRNELKFIVADLMFGLVDKDHSLYKFLTRRGVSDAELEWFKLNPAIIDVLGTNYYHFHEQQWRVPRWHGDPGWIRPSKQPVGYARIAAQYWQRYQLLLPPELRPTELRLTEYNLRGTVTDRISGLKHLGEECWKLLDLDIPITQMCPYPDRDQMCWSTECTKVDTRVDGHGMVFWMDEQKQRHHSLLSHYFGLLARGEATPEDLPAFTFQSPVDTQLEGFLPLMHGWKWINPHSDIGFAHYKKSWASQPIELAAAA